MKSYQDSLDENGVDCRPPSPDCLCKLRTISSIPGVSTIYYCAECNVYWEYGEGRGWDRLAEDLPTGSIPS